MSFSKTGMLKTAKVQILDDISSWSNFRKESAVQNTTTIDDTQKEALDKEADFQVVATIDPEKFIYIHTTIMAGVKTEKNGFWITSETEKYINDNHDAWTCDDLLKDYKSFKRATTFVEHDQRLELAKGKCIDVIARNMGDTLLIDVLFSVDRRHKDLVANIENGIINAVSMGCTTAQTICSVCGNVASDPNSYCEHLKRGNKGRSFRLDDGTSRKAAEICKGNTFFDVSLVANPAFAGAVFRKILSSSEVSNQLLANILSSKIEAMYKDDEVLLKAASKESDAINISIKHNGAIEISTANQLLKSDEVLSKEEIEKICKFVPQESKKHPIMGKILEQIFGKKEATHPIQNDSGKKDFPIGDGYADIPYRDRFRAFEQINQTTAPVLDLKQPQICILEISPKTKTMSRVDEFECFKCGFKSELWKVKASSIDAGQTTAIECPRCFYVAEESLFKTAKTKFKPKDEVTITTKKEKGEHGKIVSIRGPLFLIKLDNGKTVMKSDKDFILKEKKASVFVASRDIPVENDEGTYWFDEQGNSVITKGEKVSFVTTVEDGEYGCFTTETGEDFFMPMSHVNSTITR